MIHLDHYHLLQCFLPLLNFSSSFFCHPSAGSQTPLKPQLLQLLILSLCSVWRRKWQATPVSLSGKSHGHRNLVGCSPWGHKESEMTEQLMLTYTYFVTPWTSPWNCLGQNTKEGSLSLLQEIFPTQGSNPGLPRCK